MSSVLIREHITTYAVVLNEIVAVLEAPRKKVVPADRRTIMESLYAMTDLNTMLIFHFNRRRISAAQMMEMRKKIADLADLSPGQGCRPPATREGHPVRTREVECHTTKHQRQQDFLREAMERLGMTRQRFADRIGGSKRALDAWLLPADSKEFRPMPGPIWTLVREVLRNSGRLAQNPQIDRPTESLC